MRGGLVMLSAAVVLGIAACGGGDKADPLTLEQRFNQDGDPAGYEPDPVEGGKHSADNVEEFVGYTQQWLSSPTVDAATLLTEAGFAGAIVGTRFVPGSDGEHGRGDPHVVMGVVQFGTEEGARDAVEWYHEDGRKPCPGKCAVTISEFEVDGVSDAKGVHRLVTAERLQQTGEQGEPSDAFDIWFADGPFAYYVGTFGAPGEATTEAVTEAIAKRMYDRVKGAPPPER